MKTFSMTDQGKTRDMNQDCVFSSEKPIGNLPNLFVVADGMGGHNAGDYASHCAVDTIVKYIAASTDEKPAALLTEALREANRILLEEADRNVQLLGMGTTAVAAVVEGRHLWVANVGDSRLYLVDDAIRQVTRDHSLVEEMVRRGELTREEARNHPDKNIITRALGAVEEVNVDIYEVELQKGQLILMCTDGLSNMIPDSEIVSIVRSQHDIIEKVERLVHTANENGGKDNITVIVIEPE